MEKFSLFHTVPWAWGIWILSRTFCHSVPSQQDNKICSKWCLGKHTFVLFIQMLVQNCACPDDVLVNTLTGKGKKRTWLMFSCQVNWEFRCLIYCRNGKNKTSWTTLVLQVSQENWSGMWFVEFLNRQYINRDTPSSIQI